MASGARSLVAVSLLLPLASCLPVPHREADGPDLELTLHDEAGLPVVNRSFDYVIHAPWAQVDPVEECRGGIRGRTDEEGAITFRAPRHWSFIVFLMPAHRAYQWTVCSEPDGEGDPTPVYRGTAYRNSAPSSEDLFCRAEDIGPPTCRGPFGASPEFIEVDPSADGGATADRDSASA
jgi:hypothetical protein